jgi:ketosteroid isomerase-like protein
MNNHTRTLTLIIGTVAAAALAACSSAPQPRTAASRRAAPAASETATASAQAQVQSATAQVIRTEQAFAATMADRSFKNFLTFLSPDAIFFSGSTVEHGPAEIAEQWAPYFQGRRAPFSWQPDHVDVLADGKLALSTGPLLQQGKIVGRFDSVWRLEAPNTWRIVFDKGEAVCSAPPPTTNSNGSQFFNPQ